MGNEIIGPNYGYQTIVPISVIFWTIASQISSRKAKLCVRHKTGEKFEVVQRESS